VKCNDYESLTGTDEEEIGFSYHMMQNNKSLRYLTASLQLL
jgi:hypothetical protein